MCVLVAVIFPRACSLRPDLDFPCFQCRYVQIFAGLCWSLANAQAPNRRWRFYLLEQCLLGLCRRNNLCTYHLGYHVTIAPLRLLTDEITINTMYAGRCRRTGRLTENIVCDVLSNRIRKAQRAAHKNA